MASVTTRIAVAASGAARKFGWEQSIYHDGFNFLIVCFCCNWKWITDWLGCAAGSSIQSALWNYIIYRRIVVQFSLILQIKFSSTSSFFYIWFFSFPSPSNFSPTCLKFKPQHRKSRAALDNMGASIEVAKYMERLVPSTRIISVDGVAPALPGANNFIAPSASVIGNVTIGEHSR